MKKPSKKKEMILTTAMNLFMQESYINVGVDQIITEDNVTKAIFYEHFPSNLIKVYYLQAF